MNAAEKLAREISRVTTVIGHYEALIGMAKRGEVSQLSPLTETVVLPMIRGQLENAFKAAGSNDAIDVKKALAVLEGIKD